MNIQRHSRSSMFTAGYAFALFASAGLAADQLELRNGVLVYQASPGAVNTVTVVQQNARVVLTDSTAPLPPCVPIPGMQRPTPNAISLPADSVLSVRIDLGDGDDDQNLTDWSGAASANGFRR